MSAMRSPISSLSLPALAAALFLAAPGAQASTLVFGAGYATDCSNAARFGDHKQEAIDLCDMAINLQNLSQSDRAKTYVNRGVLRLQRKEFARAHSDIDMAEKLKPDIGEIYVNRGVVLFMQDRYAEAIASFDKGIAMTVDEMEKAYYNRGLTHEQMENFPLAYADFVKANEINPRWSWPRRELTRYTVTSR